MRTTATFLTGAALVAILTLLCLAPVRGTTSRGYQAFDGPWTSLGSVGYPPESSSGNLGTSHDRPTASSTPQSSPSPATTPRSATPSPRPTRAPRIYFGASATGSASFYQYVPGGAAAAARLRDAIGPNWRNKRVTVWYGGRHVTVVLSDFESSLILGRLIDLNESSFAQLVGPGWYQRGRVTVRVEW